MQREGTELAEDHALPVVGIDVEGVAHGAADFFPERVGRIGVALQPLADRLAQLLLERPVLHADETPVAQLDPGKGKTHRAYLWAYRSTVLDTGPPIVVFDYQMSRAGRHAKAFLTGWRGHLMVDDFSGYKALFTNGVTELGCMAHARGCGSVSAPASWTRRPVAWSNWPCTIR